MPTLEPQKLNKVLPYFTFKILLLGLERPYFPDCLTSQMKVVEGESLDIKCLVTGIPVPYLKCELKSFDGRTLQTIPRDGGGTHFTLSTRIFTVGIKL